MRKNRRNNAKKERTIMIASSVFVLAALTMTGIYMKSNHTQEQDDGYTIDFTALEENVQDKYQEIAQNNQTESQVSTGESSLAGDMAEETENLDDDLDYLPMEVGSGLVTIPGLTDRQAEDSAVDNAIVQEPEPAAQKPEATPVPNNADATATPDVPQEENENEEGGESAHSADSDGVVMETPHFAESDGLLRPVSGEVLIPFSMDSGVYFSTLDQFKYNPAMMIAAEEGAEVYACADGRVIDIFENEEIGHAVTMELGDGYQITYGQLEGICVTQGSYVNPGETIAMVAAPTKYFSVEGSNLYLKLTMDGTPVNPEALMR